MYYFYALVGTFFPTYTYYFYALVQNFLNFYVNTLFHTNKLRVRIINYEKKEQEQSQRQHSNEKFLPASLIACHLHKIDTINVLRPHFQEKTRMC